MKMDSILIFAPSWIGDSVMSLGAMRAVRKAHPNARLVVLTRPWVQELYVGCDVVDETILYDPHGADRDLSLRATEEMRRAGGALLEREGFKGGPLVGVHPGATNSRAKVWQASRYAEVASKLAETRDGQVVILGGVTEGLLAEEVRARVPKERVLMLQGKTSLGELMGVLSELSVFLTNDSGPMHLAAALGVPTVAVFGPTDSRETGPYSSIARVVREPVECSPCLYRDCPIDHRCMEQVTPERVYEEALALVSS